MPRLECVCLATLHLRAASHGDMLGSLFKDMLSQNPCYRPRTGLPGLESGLEGIKREMWRKEPQNW